MRPATHIHTVVLPPVHCSGHSLSFFCDLNRELALEELLATLDLWLDWSEGAVAQQDALTEDQAYELATQDMRARLIALQGTDYRQHCLRRVDTELSKRRLFPEVLQAFHEHFGAPDARPAKQHLATTPCYH